MRSAGDDEYSAKLDAAPVWDAATEGLDVDDEELVTSLKEYLKTVRADWRDAESYVAVVRADGTIVSGDPEAGRFSDAALAYCPLPRWIAEARDNEKVKAMVLRVNSTSPDAGPPWGRRPCDGQGSARSAAYLLRMQEGGPMTTLESARSAVLVFTVLLTGCTAAPVDAVDSGATDDEDSGQGVVESDTSDDVVADPCLTDDGGSSSGPGRYTGGFLELAPGIDGASVYYPAEIANSPCTFRVIAWGNGTSATGGEAYPEYFDRLARHGFVVGVAHTNFAASGPVILDTAARVLALHEDPDSIFYGKLHGQYGVMGKSQGAIAAARDVNTDPDAIAAVLVAGAVGVVTKPALFATSDDDFLRQSTQNGYGAASSEAVYAEAAGGVDHLELDDHVGVAQLATSFMRCQLQNDDAACAYVTCAECQTEAWGDYQVK